MSKPRASSVTNFKPIFPKVGGKALTVKPGTRIIELNTPAMPMKKCFICDQRVIGAGIPMLLSTTPITNTDFPSKIGHIMGDQFMVVVSADDVLCRKCHALVNHVDKLESDLELVKKSLQDHLKNKYSLNDELVKPVEIELQAEVPDLFKTDGNEYLYVTEQEFEEEGEPVFKRAKVTVPVQRGKFRAIQPKPPGLQLLKCSHCNFFTTQSEALFIHELECNTLLYKCTMCDTKFDSQKTLRTHKMEVHLSKWTCHFCELNFREEEQFTNHMKSHLGDRNETILVKNMKCEEKENGPEKYTCLHCFSESFEDLTQLENHIATHINPVTFKCVRCDVGFKTKQELVSHVKTHESETQVKNRRKTKHTLLKEGDNEPQEGITIEEIFVCTDCNLHFIQKDLYKEHLKIHVSSERNEMDVINDLMDEIHALKNEESASENPVNIPNLAPVEEQTTSSQKEAEITGENSLESNQLLDENTLGVHYLNLLTNDNDTVSLQTFTNDKSKNGDELIASDTGFCTDNSKNEKSVEDILTLNMFQVTEQLEPENNETAEVKEDPDEGTEKTKSKTYVCADCKLATKDLETLKAHFSEKHKTLKCIICEEVLETEEELKNHIKDEHKLYECSFCDGEFKSMTELAKHVESHHADELGNRTHSCSYCSEKFSSKRAALLHESTHPESLTISCPDCDRKFSRDKFLHEHREIAHVESHCRFCNKCFNNVKQLKSHEARHLRFDKNKFVCPYCGRVFQTQTGLRHHRAIHTGEFNYKCEFCEKGFVSRVRYEEHRASHTKEERYKCEICGKKFTFQATYWIHRKWHDNPFPYKCEFCNRLFKHSSLLSVHRRKHTGERPYECQHCSQSFTVGNTLKRHLMLHTGKFPYVCKHCEKGFTAKHKMALHMSKAHDDNELLEKQMHRKNKIFKMVVNDNVKDESVSLCDEAWVVAEDEQNGEHLLTIKTEEGENIPCTLLSDEVLCNMGAVPTQVVEIVLKDFQEMTGDLGKNPNEQDFEQLHYEVRHDNLSGNLINNDHTMLIADSCLKDNSVPCEEENNLSLKNDQANDGLEY